MAEGFNVFGILLFNHVCGPIHGVIESAKLETLNLKP
jgi:hypothetical protein